MHFWITYLFGSISIAFDDEMTKESFVSKIVVIAALFSELELSWLKNCTGKKLRQLWHEVQNK